MNVRFYVADNISPDLIERMRRYGRVILKPAKTVHKDDPQYWKLLILSEKDLGAAVIVDFWQIFFLAQLSQVIYPKQNKGIAFLYRELLPIEHGLPTGIRSGFKNVSTLSICGPAPPVSDIENLVARRGPNENYREFIRTMVHPRTSTTRMMGVFEVFGKIGHMINLARRLLPSRLYKRCIRFSRSLKMRIFSRVF